LRSGEHERHLAISTVAQQLSQVVVVLSMLAAITVLARRLSLPEFGTYGLLVSLTTYVLFIQGSVETAAVKAIAEARDQAARDRAFSTALSLYAIAGFAAGALIAVLGVPLLHVFNIPARLHHQALLSIFALATVTCIGWPTKVFQDVLRGSQRFIAAAIAESVAYAAVGILLIGLAVTNAPLWLLVAAGAAPPLLTGTASALILISKALPYRYRRAGVTSESVGSFLRLSSFLSLIGISGLVIYSLDRAILSAFRSPSVVGLYEGPVRAHNLVQQTHGTLTIPVVPAATRFLAEGDVQRTRDLLVRGTRYTLAAVVPLTIVFMVLARPILIVWLGPRFATAATAMTLLVGYWLVNANTGVAGAMLVAAGKVRHLTKYAAAVAALNLALSLALTPRFGLNGVVLGTTLSYLLGFPFFFTLALSTFGVGLSYFAREAWLPAYMTGGVIAALLLFLRITVELDSLAKVVGVGVVAMLAYWALYYAAWLRPNERLLVKSVALTLVRR
jgi:O-antigen/teichoic acid export membrane protein